MLFAHWMLLVATFLPIVAVAFAKAKKGYDNHQPRVYIDKLDENTMQKRMAWAQENSWEALMMFAPAVLLATVLHANPNTMNLLVGLLPRVWFICGVMPKIWRLRAHRFGLWVCCVWSVCMCLLQWLDWRVLSVESWVAWRDGCAHIKSRVRCF